MEQPNGNRLNGNGKKEANRDTLAKKCEKVIVHLEAAFEIVDSKIKPRLEEASDFLEPDERNVLGRFYIEDKSHDEIAEVNGDTVRQVYELRESSLQKLAQNTGESVTQTEARLRLVGWFKNHCSPEVINELSSPQKP